MRENYFSNEFVKIWLENGIIVMEYTSKLEINIEIAKLGVIERIKVCNGMTRPLFADASTIKSIDKQARTYLATPEAIKYISAGAFLIRTPIEELMGNFWLKFDKPPIPTKMFTDKSKALSWLEVYKNIN